MGTQKQIENRILNLLEKNEFLSGRDFYERMRGVDLKDIYETLQLLLRLQYIGTLTTSDGRTLYFLEPPSMLGRLTLSRWSASFTTRISPPLSPLARSSVSCIS